LDQGREEEEAGGWRREGETSREGESETGKESSREGNIFERVDRPVQFERRRSRQR
jgi:hypothetical protein